MCENFLAGGVLNRLAGTIWPWELLQPRPRPSSRTREDFAVAGKQRNAPTGELFAIESGQCLEAHLAGVDA